jgi:hypothetical protein
MFDTATIMKHFYLHFYVFYNLTWQNEDSYHVTYVHMHPNIQF